VTIIFYHYSHIVLFFVSNRSLQLKLIIVSLDIFVFVIQALYSAIKIMAQVGYVFVIFLNTLKNNISNRSE